MLTKRELLILLVFAIGMIVWLWAISRVPALPDGPPTGPAAAMALQGEIEAIRAKSMAECAQFFANDRTCVERQFAANYRWEIETDNERSSFEGPPGPPAPLYEGPRGPVGVSGKGVSVH